MKPTKHVISLTMMLLASSFALQAQHSIKGKLLDTLQVPIPFNPIALISYHDSTIVKGVMTDVDGHYTFEGAKKGNYRLKISAMGFNTYYSDKIIYDSITSIVIPDIKLQADGGFNLNEVSIATQKKTVEFKNGNITMWKELPWQWVIRLMIY